MQDLLTKTDSPSTRMLATGSWLGLPYQGRGIGTLMRQVVCTFAIDHLGARLLSSGYIEGNERSAGVSRKVGYVDNGRTRVTDPTSAGYRWERQLPLTPEHLVRPAFVLAVHGLEAFRRQIGLDRDPTGDAAGGQP